MTQRPQPVVIHAMVAAVLTSGLAVLGYFLPSTFTPEAVLLLSAFGNTVIIVGIAFFATKDQVTPVSDPMLAANSSVTTPDGKSATVTPDTA